MKQLPENIKEWLADPNRNFWTGLSILSEHISNKTLIRNLSRKENKYTKEKLLGEIKKLARNFTTHDINLTDINDVDPGDQDDQIPEDENDEQKNDPPADPPGGTDTNTNTNTPPPTTQPVPPVTGLVMAYGTAEAFEQLTLSYTKMYNLKGMLSNKMRELPEAENSGRQKLMARIQDIRKTMDEIEVKLAYFKEHGTLPPLADAPIIPPADSNKETEIPADALMADRMMRNERSTISKLRKQIAEGHADPEVIKKLEEKLQGKIDLVERIKKQIDAGNGI